MFIKSKYKGDNSIKNLKRLFTIKKEGRKAYIYLTTDSTHFIYGYMASDIW